MTSRPYSAGEYRWTGWSSRPSNPSVRSVDVCTCYRNTKSTLNQHITRQIHDKCYVNKNSFTQLTMHYPKLFTLSQQLETTCLRKDKWVFNYCLLDLLGNKVVQNCCQLTYKYRETATSAIDSRSWGNRVLLVQVPHISQNIRGLFFSSIGHVLQAVQRGQHHCIGHVLQAVQRGQHHCIGHVIQAVQRGQHHCIGHVIQAVQRGQHHCTLFLFSTYFFRRKFEHFYSVEEKQACEAWKELILCICISKRSLLLEPDMATLRWKAKTSQSHTCMVESSNCAIAYSWWQCWRHRMSFQQVQWYTAQTRVRVLPVSATTHNVTLPSRTHPSHGTVESSPC